MRYRWLACISVGLGLLLVAEAGMAARARSGRGAPPPMPVFDFLGQSTEIVTTMTGINGRPCAGTVRMRCTNPGLMAVAGEYLVHFGMDYYQGRLYRVGGRFEPASFVALLAAFTEKYGRPDLASGRSGGRTARWRFKGGALDLVERDHDRDAGHFEFLSTGNQPPPDKPIVDF